MEELKALYMLGRDKLKLYFEDKKAKLSWKEQELTKGPGLHIALKANGIWHDSSSAEWRINSINQDKVYIDIVFKDIPVTSSLILSLMADNELLWDLGMQVKQAIDIADKKIGLFVSEEYKRWFNSAEEGQFPLGFNWENVFLNQLDSRGFGVKPEGKYPGILFEAMAKGVVLLQNTNEELKGRAMQFDFNLDRKGGQYEPGYYRLGCGRVKVIEEEEFFDKYIEAAKKEFIAAKSFGNDKLSVFFDKRMARLYWKGLELTKHFALNTIFFANGVWYGSSYTDWEITRIGHERLHVNINYKDIPVVHKWIISLTKENELVWDVEMWVREPVAIVNKKMGLFITDKYTRWFNATEEGDFPAAFNWDNIFLSRTDSRAFGVKPSEGYPGIFFEVEAEGVPLIQNTDGKFTARAIQFELIDSNKNGYYAPGQYKWGSGRIKVVEEQAAIHKFIEDEKKKLEVEKSFSNEKLRLYFDEGKAKLFWREVELTKGFGLHTTLNIEGNWYDSARAQWQFKKLGQGNLSVNVCFRDIPVTQNWVFCLTKENVLSWDVDIQVKKALQVQQKKISLFLSDKYTRWFNSSEEGQFPGGFNWETIFLNQANSPGVGVRPEGGYPGVLFEATGQGAPLLQNTNEELKGRAVQFELTGDNQCVSYEPDIKYKLFSGKIKIIEDERIIDDYIENGKLLPFDSLGNEIFYIFGDTQELHDKVSGTPGDFKEKIIKIQQRKNSNQELNIKIGVSRFNFFRIKEIIEFVFSFLGKQLVLNPVLFSLFPAQKIYFNFINYLEQIKLKINGTAVQLVLVDKELFDILLTISSQANIYNERKLIRLLGVISEYAFIGPQIVVVDPFHRCNISCAHCWVHTPKIKHTQEFLDRKFDFEMYKQMINDFAELKVDNVIFQGDGEPLLYDRFFDMVRYARSKNIEAIFFTNGLLLNEGIAKEAVDLGVSQIFCSLPAGTDKTYELITRSKEPWGLKRVLDNLKYLTQAKRKKNTINPRLIMTHVIHALNYAEIVDMAKNDVEAGADVIRFYLIRLDENIKTLQLKPKEVESIRDSMKVVKGYLKDKQVELLDTTDFQLNHYEKDTGNWSKGVFLREGCLLGWFFCLIPALGDISLCCHLRTVGYLKEKSFKEIWNSKEYEKYRAQAKYLKDNKDTEFLNGVKLYDEHCEQCDTHQVIRDIQEDLKNYNLDKFVFR